MSRLPLRSVSVQPELPEEAYYSAIPAVRSLIGRPLSFSAPVTCLIGENGTGKSTLLEAVAVAAGLNAEGGTRNFRFASRETHSALYRYVRLGWNDQPDNSFFLRAESFYGLSSAIDDLNVIHAYGGRSLHTLSHGEAFLRLVQERLSGRGLYLLDEPEAALSPTRQLTLLCELHRLVSEGAQILMATHSPLLMAYPEAQLLQTSEQGLRAVALQDTEHYRVTRRALTDPEFLPRFLGDRTGP